MAESLLTIIVPTYNRSSNLAMLLRVLREETVSLGDDVCVFVSDNASTDETHSVIMQAAANWPKLITHRHTSNIGADLNFCYCVSSVQTKWFWLIGDDDMPKRGLIGKVIKLLREHQPALLYMESEWIMNVNSPDQGAPIASLHIETHDAMSFANATHIWVTYISGMIVNKDCLMQNLEGKSINRFVGSLLVQLGWVLPVLRSQGPFVIIRDSCILATMENSGGYDMLEVFCVNYPRVVKECFGPSDVLSLTLIRKAMLCFLPGRVWEIRHKSLHICAAEHTWVNIKKELGFSWMYWALLLPLGRFPNYLAMPLYQLWRLANFLRKKLRT